MYDKAGGRPHIAKQLGNTEAGYGVKFAGRGFVQLPALRLGRTKPRSTVIVALSITVFVTMLPRVCSPTARLLDRGGAGEAVFCVLARSGVVRTRSGRR